ncbi:site-specific integrase [Methylocystis sp. ATCC 49242]|uniref:tyrosine-type recombinase/integrase n=1 Tax=Methylocystis sp. ATCC 49242 TaxID=622637 RepID=UPI0001F87C85|nr:site-specific integrase [Methylocystis sp. ATCC 49242]
MAKLTKRLIDALRPPESGDLFVWDGELKGFGVRVKPSGAGAYIIQYRTPIWRTRRLAFAKVGTITPEEARARARRLLADAAEGGDPSAERHEARSALTVAELCDQYLEAARAGLVLTRFRKPKRASTIAIDEGRVARHIAPLIGKKVASKITRADLQRMADAIAAGKTAATIRTKMRGVARVEGGAGTAARVVELIGGIWSWAEKRGLVEGANPARGVETHRGDAKDRILTAEELARLGVVLREQEAVRPAPVAALRIIALTGARREEICSLRWNEIDAANSCLRLQETKTGRSMRPIGRAVLDLLATLPRAGDFVFPNRTGDGHADMKKALADLFDAAGLKDTRSHDLRRTFASVAADEGYGDATIGELLGHARRGVTARHYIRRPDAALVAAADRVSACISAMLDGREAEIVELRRKATGNEHG